MTEKLHLVTAGESTPGANGGGRRDRPSRPARVTRTATIDAVGSAIAAFAVVWLPFDVAGLSAPFGFVLCWLLAFVVIYGLVSWSVHGTLIAKDRLATVYVWAGGTIALLPLGAMLWFVVVKGAPVVLSHFPSFLVHDMRYGGADSALGKVGVAHAIVGTVEQVGIATLLTAPIAVMAATYLTEATGTFSRVVRVMADAKTGLPSIIAGLFVYLVWVQPRGTSGYSGLAASFALATMILPIITRTAEEMIRLVPGSLREAALALGAPRWRVTLRVILPTARAGLVSAVILGVARAVGETAPVLFTAHGSDRMNWNPLHGVQSDLPLAGFEKVLSSNNHLQAQGWGDLLVLVVLVLVLFALARLVGSRSPGRRRLSIRRRFRPAPEEAAA